MEREVTNKLLELIDNYALDPRQVVLMCLKWMSEDDVREMCKANEINLEDEEDAANND
jgi:hypothetical protein